MEKHILTILSAEDDLDDQFLIKEAIEEAGIQASVNFVSDGLTLIEKLTKQYRGSLPDILLLDLNMPVMDGITVLKVLRERKDFDDLPIIILTTSNNQNEIDQCYSLGAKSFITKPSSFKGMVEVVKSFNSFKEKQIPHSEK